MVDCPDCHSTSLRLIEEYYDGDDLFDVFLECLNCTRTCWITVCEDELEELEESNER